MSEGFEWAGDATWQHLPPRARSLFLLDSVTSLAVPGAIGGAIAGTIASALLDAPGRPVLVLGGAATLCLAGVLWGTWLGLRRYQLTTWRLDADGLAVRRGRLWQQETRVPATRVQHLDIKRGPLQRRRGLATLVVHTAGTRSSAVTVPNLDDGDAELLRERLSSRIDGDDDGDA